jgi:hypothetical protein
MNEIITRLADLPTAIPAYTLLTKDGDFVVVLNARMSHDRRIEAYRHELKHIKGYDFSKENVELIEIHAHLKGE